jgi:hypothetical protein
LESVQRIVEKSIDSSATLTPWIWAPRCTLSKTTKKMTKKVERRHGRPSELGQKRRCRCCFRDAAAAAASGQGGSASPRGGPRRTASWIFGGGGLLERGEKEDSFEEEKVIFLLLSQRRLLPSLELSFFSVRRRHQRNKKMVSQQLSCPCPRRLPASLLPASSLEPLQEDERVLCSFERVGVAAGGAAEDAASAAEEPNANAVGTLHVTSR